MPYFLPFKVIWIIHVQATWLVNPSSLIVDQKWHWQVVVKFNRAIKGEKLAMGEKWLYNAPIVVFPPSHFSGGKTDLGGKMAL